MANSKPTAPEISRRIFGGVLEYDGAGHYPGLELLNLVFCGTSNSLLPAEENKFTRRAHDFARKLVWSEVFSENPIRQNVFYDSETENAVRHLMECLQLEIPSKPKRVDWSRAHFFPYTRSLIHWDARERAGNAEIRLERKYLRGGGALAYKILRTDRDKNRWSEVNEGFASLYPEAAHETPLEQLVSVLAEHGASSREPRSDLEDEKAISRDDFLEEVFRDGMRNVLSHQRISCVARIRAVMGWTGLWLVLMQHSRAHSFLERPVPPLICDCDSARPQLKRAAQKSLKDAFTAILDAFDHAYREETGEAPPRKQRDGVRGFFWGTAATVKLLNAWRGRRHFTLQLNVLETLVLAAMPDGQERTFEWFVQEWLHDRCGIVVARAAAEKASLLNALDASIFEDNELQLQRQMAAAGLLTEYSDTTRMVSAEGLA